MLLRQSGIEPETRAPAVDEEAVIEEIESREGRTLALQSTFHPLNFSRKITDKISELIFWGL